MTGNALRTIPGKAVVPTEKAILPKLRLENAKVEVNCVECDLRFEAKNVFVSEVFPCPDCGTELELVLKDKKLVAAKAPKEAEDWGE